MSSRIQLSKEDIRQNKPTREAYVNLPKTPLVLVLDNVTNSYNVGSFIRLADAFAIEKIIVCGELTISDKKLKKLLEMKLNGFVLNIAVALLQAYKRY